jgi:hypothetical protein
MFNRKWLLVGAAVLGAAFTAQFAHASPPARSPAEKPSSEVEPARPGAKTGEACKANADCDQNASQQDCIESKCTKVKRRPLPPT